MDWKFKSEPSVFELSKYIEAQDLDSILNYECLLHEIKSENYELINYLSKDDNLKKIISYIIEENDDKNNYDRYYRFPYKCHQIISSENKIITDSIVYNNNIMKYFWSFILNKNQLNEVLAGYFSRCAIAIYNKNSKEVVNFLKKKKELYLKGFLYHFYSRNITELFKVLLFVKIPYLTIFENKNIIYLILSNLNGNFSDNKYIISDREDNIACLIRDLFVRKTEIYYFNYFIIDLSSQISFLYLIKCVFSECTYTVSAAITIISDLLHYTVLAKSYNQIDFYECLDIYNKEEEAKKNEELKELEILQKKKETKKKKKKRKSIKLLEGNIFVSKTHLTSNQGYQTIGEDNLFLQNSNIDTNSDFPTIETVQNEDEENEEKYEKVKREIEKIEIEQRDDINKDTQLNHISKKIKEEKNIQTQITSNEDANENLTTSNFSNQNILTDDLENSNHLIYTDQINTDIKIGKNINFIDNLDNNQNINYNDLKNERYNSDGFSFASDFSSDYSTNDDNIEHLKKIKFDEVLNKMKNIATLKKVSQCQSEYKMSKEAEVGTEVGTEAEAEAGALSWNSISQNDQISQKNQKNAQNLQSLQSLQSESPCSGTTNNANNMYNEMAVETNRMEIIGIETGQEYTQNDQASTTLQNNSNHVKTTFNIFQKEEREPTITLEKWVEYLENTLFIDICFLRYIKDIMNVYIKNIKKNKDKNILGFTTLEIIQLIKTLIKTKSKNILTEIIDEGFFDISIDIFFKFKWNNLLHISVCDLLQTIIFKENEYSYVLYYILALTTFLPKCLRYFDVVRRCRNIKKKKKKKKLEALIDCGYKAHLLHICQILSNKSLEIKWLSNFLVTVSGWNDIIIEELNHYSLYFNDSNYINDKKIEDTNQTQLLQNNNHDISQSDDYNKIQNSENNNLLIHPQNIQISKDIENPQFSSEILDNSIIPNDPNSQNDSTSQNDPASQNSQNSQNDQNYQNYQNDPNYQNDQNSSDINFSNYSNVIDILFDENKNVYPKYEDEFQDNKNSFNFENYNQFASIDNNQNSNANFVENKNSYLYEDNTNEQNG
ncbi:protein SOC1 [Plasmodium yoelii yoelii]|uniref:Protein SOC1 n=1 Tax=Plasmodium yoelii yoelii TaxID=73239 RepID=A0AAE9WLV3_PLAYO|nr:protein SOC1 [Plasmodium yoelii yoelii]